MRLKFKVRYYVKDGGLMMQRKFLGLWWDYERFNNRKVAIKERLNKMLHDAEKEIQTLNNLTEEEYRILEDIKKARGEKPGFSQETVLKMKVRPLRHKLRTLADESWAVFSKIFGRGTDMATTISGIPGARCTHVNGHDVGEGFISGHSSDEFVGAKDFPVKPESRNQQKKGGNNNQQNQQNR